MRPSKLFLTTSLLFLSLLGSPFRAESGGGHSGLPTPQTTLHANKVEVSFELPETFPVPVVEVRLNGTGPWRLAVDTAMGGTVLLRKELATKMGLPLIGKAMVGDSSGQDPKPADLVRIDSMRLGQLEVSDIIGIGFEAGEAHLADIPDDLHGLLGNRIYADLLMTLDYPSRRIVFSEGELSADDPSVVEFENQGNVMVIDVTIAGNDVPLTVDSGSRGTITLPRSLADSMPILGELRQLAAFSTVNGTYERQAARLDGRIGLAGTTLVQPELSFADEHTPKLIGYGVLKHYALTVDQAHGRLRWVPGGSASIAGVTVEH